MLALWGVAVAITGGLDARLAGIPIRSRDPWRPLAAAFALFVLAAILDLSLIHI